MGHDLFGTLSIGFGLLAAAAVLAPLFAGRKRLAGAVHFALTAAAGAAFLAVSVRSLAAGGHAEAFVRLGPLSVPFLIDGFAGVFVGLIALMAASAALYSIRYMEHYEDYGVKGYYFWFPLFVLGMIALVTVDDLGPGFTAAWQIMTVASYFLIRYESRKRGNVRSAGRYLALMELAWLLVTGGAFFIDGHSFGHAMPEIAAGVARTGGLPLALFLGFLLVGFGFKAGVFPLGQLWLPDAHSIAPSPVSALLSGVMLKTGVYGLLRTFFFLAPASGSGFDQRAWGGLLAAIGVVTLFIGTVQSVKQSDTKRLLAFSSIGQIGYIVFASGAALLLAAGPDAAVRSLAAVAAIGALYHILNHAVFKGLLFLSSGSLLYATGTKDLNKLGGLIVLMPVSAVVAGIASLSISGMPPTSGFASKWAIVASSLLGGGTGGALVLFGVVALFTSAVTLACYVKFFGMAFTSAGAERTVSRDVREVPASMLAPKIALAVLCVVQGLFPVLFYDLIASAFRSSEGFLLSEAFPAAGAPGGLSATALGVRVAGLFGSPFNAAASPLLILGLLGLALLAASFLRKAGGGEERKAPTWLCGYQDSGDANRYADRNMFAALRGLFRWTGGKTENPPP